MANGRRQRMGLISTKIIRYGINVAPLHRAIDYLLFFVNPNSCLHLAVLRGNTAMVQLLIDHRCCLNYEDQNGMTALYSASFWGHLDIVRLLLDNGASPHIHTREYHEPLHVAAMLGHTAIAQLLLENGANPNYPNFATETPLDYAVRYNNPPIVQLFLEKGASPRSVDVALGNAVRSHNLQITQLLLEKDPSPESQSRALGDAISLHNLLIVELLLDKGVDCNAPCDYHLQRPLHLAMSGANPQTIQLLLAHGANPNIPDSKQRTPLCCTDQQQIVQTCLYWSRHPVNHSPNPALHELIAANQKYRRTRRYDQYYSTILLCDPAKARTIYLLYLIYQRPSNLTLLPKEMFVEIVEWL